MKKGPPRVAFFTDSFHEVNGVGLTSRQLDAFARRRGLPFFSCHAGPENKLQTDGQYVLQELRRGPLAMKIEADLFVDPFLLRHRSEVREALRAFQPDVVHFTGPNDVSIMGALLAKQLSTPTTASWHTNVHEFAAWRLEKMLRWAPQGLSRAAASGAERSILWICAKLYGSARTCFAPNPELIDMLIERTGKPTHVMHRGVDVELFNPVKRTRSDSTFELGYVGRISAEKNVRFLKRLEDGLRARGKSDFRITVVGHGGDQTWLEENLETGVFPGVLKDEPLAKAFANFDLFVFPSFTDTYGNVINEAMASGAPCIVTKGGGPKYLIRDQETGMVAQSEEHFIEAVAGLMDDPDRLARMREASRKLALDRTWDRVFERLYDQYAAVVEQSRSAG